MDSVELRLYRTDTICGSSSVGRASAFQAEGRGFESRLPLKICFECNKDRLINLPLTFLKEFIPDEKVFANVAQG